MSNDSYTEVTTESWFSRMTASIKAVLFGLILLAAAFSLLFWNEGRAVKRAQDLTQGAASVQSVSPDSLQQSNEGKLVHMTGPAKTDEILNDKEFGVSAPAIKLERKVQIYQWKETEKSETTDKVGGGRVTKNTYSYDKTWSDDHIDSKHFKSPDDHQNPSDKKYLNVTETAQKVTLGAHQLSPSLIGQFDEFEEFPMTDKELAAVPAELKEQLKVDNGQFYLGLNPDKPAVGDYKIAFRVAKPGVVSILAMQQGDTFSSFPLNSKRTLEEILRAGSFTADQMFQQLEKENTMWTWICRVVGFLLMWSGLSLLFSPIVTFVRVLPFLGDLLEIGVGFFTAVVAAGLSLVTIGIGWFSYRPVLSVGLISMAVVGLIGLTLLSSRLRASRTPHPVPNP